MDNANKPAYPLHLDIARQAISKADDYMPNGLTKREKACIELGIPDTGDEEIDRLIRKAERKKVATAAMQGLCASEGEGVWWEHEALAKESVKRADALLKELEEIE